MLRKPKVVSDWRDAPRWLSVRFGAAALLIQTTWLALPAQFVADYPPQVGSWVGSAVGILTLLSIVGRLISQDLGEETSPEEPSQEPNQ